VDGRIEIISIIRILLIEETYAKSSVVTKMDWNTGDILPKFYIDFENKDGRDAGKDIALEVERLKKLGWVELSWMYVMMEEVRYLLL
jgi:carboxyl-terminal processing protease